jgi:beta-1,4-mannosyl-glycoprotein beta-1,4-N-acetylglucosaminyltransferase
MAKIYDCFAFFNELDLLEVRLEELYDVVDHFVLVESPRTFQKNPKPLYFKDNQERYKKYLDKIIHIVVDEFPHFFTRFRVPKTWDYENDQREFLLKGLVDAQPDDLVIVSDLDEIPLANKVLEYKNTPGIRVFEQYLCFYYVNNVCTHMRGGLDDKHNHDGYGFWRGSVMVEYKLIKNIKSTRLFRDLPIGKMTLIPKGGWHFSYMGGVNQIIKKLEAYSHREFNNDNFKNPDFILQSIRDGKSIFDPDTTFRLVDIEKSGLQFPKALQAQPEKYNDLILPL